MIETRRLKNVVTFIQTVLSFVLKNYKLNLMCEKRSYQIINLLTVNQTVFCYY